MSTIFNDKVALITGAGRAGGIGAAVAKRLAQAGVHVVVGDLCAPAAGRIAGTGHRPMGGIAGHCS